MASIILRTAGGTLGNALLPGIGGAFLGSLGRLAGGALDGALGLGAKIEGPRLDNLGVQDSRYGAGIPIVYGNARIAGNVIWSTDLIQTTHTESAGGGKGGGGSAEITTYSYSVHCAVGICAGPVGGIATIWADSKVIYADGVWTDGVAVGATIYTGTAGQGPDAFMESMLGAGSVPAYRGLAYVVLESLQLANFGNRLPNLTFEIAPDTATADPAWLGGVDAAMNQRPHVAQGSAMHPLVLSGSGGAARRVLVGGYQVPGDTVFMTAEYDIGGDAPAEIARAQSAGFTAVNPQDQSWALAPDGRYLAMYLLDSTMPLAQFFVLYDTVTRQFGDVLTLNLAAASATRQLAWLDAQHVVIEAVSGGVRGLQVLARAGMNLVDLGFHGVWGAGSAATRQPLGYAQFTPLGGGLMHYMTDVAGASFTAIYARPLTWRNNALAAGNAYTLTGGLAPPAGSGAHANLVRTATREWTLCYATVDHFSLMSFEPGAVSAAVTRGWQDFSPGFGTGTTHMPVAFGNRLVFAQRGAFDNYFRLSEIKLESGGFTLAADGAAVADVTALTSYFSAIRLDHARLLITGTGGFAFDIAQLGVIRRGAAGNGLDAVTGDILGRAGYDEADYDLAALGDTVIDGYVLQEPMTARAALQPLQAFRAFDLVESADRLVAVPQNAGAAVAVPAGEGRAAPEGEDPPPPLEITRAQEIDLPAEIAVDYIDAGRNFEVNSQRARRTATAARAVRKLALPIVCSAGAAKRMAETRLFTSWAERELAKLRVSRRYLALDPGDIAVLDDGRRLRVTAVSQAGGLMEVQGFFIHGAAGASAAQGDDGTGTGATGAARPSSLLYLMDLPPLRGTDDQPGIYAAATGLAGWTGASVWRAADGVSYGTIASLVKPAVAGIAVTTLGGAPSYYMDRAHAVDVQIVRGELSSCTPDDLFNGANAALLGGEIIQFQTATLAGPGLYTLSNLLRGRRATETAAGAHAAGENFVLLKDGAVVFLPALLTDRNKNYQFRALSPGQSLGEAQDHDFTYGLSTLRPFAPVHVKGARAAENGSDLTLSWIRRARLNADWVDHIDAPLDEIAELYDVEIMNGGSVMRSFAGLTSPAVTYTAAQQTADWGTAPAAYTVKIYQISARYGRGRAADAVI
ncbi:MAG: phage tail protein [Bdellovibrionales bacterium]